MTLAMHKTEEKTLTHRKQKLDLQLAQWIEKYDIEIGDREEELQRLIQRFITLYFVFNKLVRSEFTDTMMLQQSFSIWN